MTYGCENQFMYVEALIPKLPEQDWNNQSTPEYRVKWMNVKSNNNIMYNNIYYITSYWRKLHFLSRFTKNTGIHETAESIR